MFLLLGRAPLFEVVVGVDSGVFVGLFPDKVSCYFGFFLNTLLVFCPFDGFEAIQRQQGSVSVLLPLRL